VSDLRRLKSIGARYDVEVSNHPDPWKKLRARLSWVFALGTSIACIPWLLGDHQAFQSECVSDAHRVFGQECSACHDRQLVPLQRMVTFNNTLHSTSDKKCQKCHRETDADHLSIQTAGKDGLVSLEQVLKSRFDEIGCAGCHTEHRGISALSHVTDANCTKCHNREHVKISPRQYDLSFADFHHHQEFAIWRQESHQQFSTETEYGKTPRIKWEQDQPSDQSAIKFSHHRHLDPQLPMPKGGVTETTELRCTDCHQADPSGAYFQPIRFEQHCHRCHQLGIPATGELPHVNLEIIHGILLDRLAKNSEIPTPRPVDVLGGPTKRPIDETHSPNELGETVKDQLDQLEERLFGSKQEVHGQPRVAGLLEAACTKCHFTERTHDAKTPWKVMPPNLPEVWMSHSRFQHDRHASVECTLCHSRNGNRSETVDRNEFYPVMNADLRNSTSIFASSSATDILMPRINVCRQCHGHKSSTMASVKDRCVDCHNYHHIPASESTPTGIRELLNGVKNKPLLKKSIDPSKESNR
jgi:hypothetical protein